MTKKRESYYEIAPTYSILNQRMNSTLRHQLRFYMELREMSAVQVARKANIAKQSLSGWMAGKRPMDISQVKRVADVFGVSLDNLMFETGLESQQNKTIKIDELIGDNWVSGIFEVRLRRILK